ncbi:MAG: hypothetical protein AMXMBFR82_48080 [Candidatus Hydrogenedentota bacterium]
MVTVPIYYPQSPSIALTAHFRNHELMLGTDNGRNYLLPGEDLEDVLTYEFEPQLPATVSAEYAVETIENTETRQVVSVTATLTTPTGVRYAVKTVNHNKLNLADVDFLVPDGQGGWVVIQQGSNIAIDLGHYDSATQTFTPCAMPELTVRLNLPTGIPQGTTYRFVVGSDAAGANALEYPDAPATGYVHPGALDSGQLAQNTWQIAWDQNNDVTNEGIFGGHLKRLTVEVQVPNADPEKQTLVAGTTAGFSGVYIVGGTLTSPMISVLSSTTPTGYFQRPNGSSFLDVDLNDDGIPNDDMSGNGSYSSAEDRAHVQAEVSRMISAQAMQESDGRHYWPGSGSGTASHANYPLWEALDSQGRGTNGFGLLQLTDENYRSRKTVWDWQEHARFAMKVHLADQGDLPNDSGGYYRRACQHLHLYPPSNAYVHGMRRMEGYDKYNAGQTDRLYWWKPYANTVEIEAAVAYGAYTIGSITAAMTQNVTQRTLTFTTFAVNVVSGSNPPDEVFVEVWGSGPTAVSQSLLAGPYTAGFGITQDLTIEYRSAPVETGANPAYSGHHRIELVAYWDPGTAQEVRVAQRIKEGAVVHMSTTQRNQDVAADAGFLMLPARSPSPPASGSACWARFWYTEPILALCPQDANGNPLDTQGHRVGGTHNWRDYNEDGVKDLDENPYGTLTEAEDISIPRPPPPQQGSLGNNTLRARGNRYANNVVVNHGG